MRDEVLKHLHDIREAALAVKAMGSHVPLHFRPWEHFAVDRACHGYVI